MLYRLISHIKFLLTATNQHGVHSPFMYRFVTKCLYSPPHFKTSKSINILLKTLVHFNIKEVHMVGGDQNIKMFLSLNGITITTSGSALICLESLNQNSIGKYLTQNSLIGNDTIVYVPEIYRDKERTILWQNLIELEPVRVSLDMFYGGIIFFRRELAKEHFKIRT